MDKINDSSNESLNNDMGIQSPTKTNQQGVNPADDPVNDLSYSDQAVDFMELIRARAFVGGVSGEVIFEALKLQFDDYINLVDKTNYVDIFYTQLAASYELVNSDDTEEHPTEIRECLGQLYQSFVDLLQGLFQEKLTISISELEAGAIDEEDLEFIFRRLYEFFILGAKNNFKVVIAKDIITRLSNLEEMDDDAFFKAIDHELESYSPLITTMTPTTFFQYRGDGEISELWENGRVIGNFLRKYSPKIYRNEEFTVELVNHITMIQQFKNDVIDDKIDDVVEQEDGNEADPEDDDDETVFISNSDPDRDSKEAKAIAEGKTVLSEYDYPDRYYGPSQLDEIEED